MGKDYILVVDEGTTGVKTHIFNREMARVGEAYRKVPTYFPETYAVEQKPMEIWDRTVQTMREAVQNAGIRVEDIAGMGLTTQRSSWTYWNKVTGEPLRNTIVWSDTRARYLRDKYIMDTQFLAQFPEVHRNLIFADIDPRLAYEYLSGREPEFKEKMQHPDTVAGLMDTWLIYNMTGKKLHAAGRGHSSTSCAYHAVNQDWDWESFDYFGMQRSMYAPFMMECDNYGMTDKEILGVEVPILANMADQAAAIFGEGCVKPRTAKSTLGTGCYLDINTGKESLRQVGLLTAIGWEINGERDFFIEGYVGGVATAIEWLKDNVDMFGDFVEMDKLIRSVPDNGGMYFVPALVGLSSTPFRDPTIGTSFMGVNANTTRAHFVRAVAEGAVYVTAHMMINMMETTGIVDNIKINGGMAKNDFICQTLANVVGVTFLRGKDVDATSKGGAEMVGVNLGWLTLGDVENNFELDKAFSPDHNRGRDQEQYLWWKKALRRSGHWYDDWDLEYPNKL